MIIQKTINYDQFKFIKGNRELNQRHLTQLTLSILEDNLLSVNPILVNADLEVIDGQHRLEVARANKLEIYYIIMPNAGVNEVRQLNTFTRVWKMLDYVESYATQGNKQYQKLLKLMEEYSISATTAISFIYQSRSHATKNGIGGSSFILNLIRLGKLDPTEKQWVQAEELGDLLYTLRSYLLIKGNSASRGFTEAVMTIYQEGLGKKLIDALRESDKGFRPSSDRREAEVQLKDIIAKR